MQQAITPHSCNLLYIVYKEDPFCSRDSAFGLKSAESLWACLINLLPESFLALSLSETTCNISGVLTRDLESSVLLPCCNSVYLTCWEGCPCQVPPYHVDLGVWLSPSMPRKQVLVAQRNPERFGNQLEITAHQTGTNHVQIEACLRRQKGSLINSRKHLNNPLWGMKPCLSVQGAGWKYCAV
jgi:hypothetical protein